MRPDLKRDDVLRLTVVLGAMLGLGPACSTGSRPAPATGSRDIAPAELAPEVTAVRDLGKFKLTTINAIPKQTGDGLAVVGELLLVSGDHFGRRPRIVVDSQIATLVGRTGDGGAIVRVPWGVRTGVRPVKVVNRRGDGSATVKIRRYALAAVPSRGEVVSLAVERTGVKATGTVISLPNARLVRYCSGGQIAYVSTASETGLAVASIDMVADNGPRLIRRQKLPGKWIVALASARSAHRAVALSDSHIAFFDTSTPAKPAVYRPQALPSDIAKEIVTADLDPRGRLLAILLRNNEVQLYDVSSPTELRRLAATKVLPGTKWPLVRDMDFGADWRTVWVISGDSAVSAGRGRFPLRLTAIRIAEQRLKRAQTFGVLSVWRTLSIPHRAAPINLAVAKGQPSAGGRTVAVPPHNAAVFITARSSKLLNLRHKGIDRKRSLQRIARILRRTPTLGTVLRTDIEGKGGVMFQSHMLLGPIDVTSDSQLLLVAGARIEISNSPPALTLEYGITTQRVFGKATPQFLALGTIDANTIARPLQMGDVRVQP